MRLGEVGTHQRQSGRLVMYRAVLRSRCAPVLFRLKTLQHLGR